MSTLTDLKNLEQHLRNANDLAAKVRQARRIAHEQACAASTDRQQGSLAWEAGTLWLSACTQHDRITELLTAAVAAVASEETRAGWQRAEGPVVR